MSTNIGKVNGREVLYFNVTDFSVTDLFPSDNWMILVIADEEQSSRLWSFAEKCIDKKVLYVYGTGGAGTEIDEVFHMADVSRRVRAGIDLYGPNAYDDAARTVWDNDIEKAFSLAVIVANYDTIPIHKMVVANLTKLDYKQVIEELIRKINTRWMPGR